MILANRAAINLKRLFIRRLGQIILLVTFQKISCLAQRFNRRVQIGCAVLMLRCGGPINAGAGDCAKAKFGGGLQFYRVSLVIAHLLEHCLCRVIIEPRHCLLGRRDTVWVISPPQRIQLRPQNRIGCQGLIQCFFGFGQFTLQFINLLLQLAPVHIGL